MKPDRRKRHPSKPDPFSASNPADVGPDTPAQMVGHEMIRPKGAPPNVQHKRRTQYFEQLVAAGHLGKDHEAKANAVLELFLSTQLGLGGTLREFVDGGNDPQMAAVMRVDRVKDYEFAKGHIPPGPLLEMFIRVIEQGQVVLPPEGDRRGSDYDLAYSQLREALELLPV